MPAAFDKTQDIPFFLRVADDILANPQAPDHPSLDRLKFPIVGIRFCQLAAGNFRDDITGDYTTNSDGIHIELPAIQLPLYLLRHPNERAAIRFYLAAAIGHETIHFRQDRHPAHFAEPMAVGVSGGDRSLFAKIALGGT